MNEAKLVKTALGSSLPVSWSAEADVGIGGDIVGSDPSDVREECSDKVDTVSAAGFEMMELLIFTAQILKDNYIKLVPDVEAL